MNRRISSYRSAWFTTDLGFFSALTEARGLPRILAWYLLPQGAYWQTSLSCSYWPHGSYWPHALTGFMALTGLFHASSGNSPRSWLLTARYPPLGCRPGLMSGNWTCDQDCGGTGSGILCTTQEHGVIKTEDYDRIMHHSKHQRQHPGCSPLHSDDCHLVVSTRWRRPTNVISAATAVANALGSGFWNLASPVPASDPNTPGLYLSQRLTSGRKQ